MIPQLTPAQVFEALAGPTPPLLLDVRTHQEHRVASIEGALLVPMDQIAARIGDLDPDRTTVVMCHHGYRSQRVALYLKSHDFTDVSNMAGGIERWSDEVDPDVPRY